jgi:Flp pilus assembly pilin Flp
MARFLREFAADTRGGTLVEYSALIGLLAAATIALVHSVHWRVWGSWYLIIFSPFGDMYH